MSEKCQTEGLRAKPSWTDKETGFKKYLDQIRENWQVIRDEGLELMKQKRLWSVDPGWRGMENSRYRSKLERSKDFRPLFQRMVG